MKRLFVTGIAAAGLFGASALAADMPVKSPYAPAFSWTGCYVGANAGGLWGKTNYRLETVADDPSHGSSGVGGGQIGCDYQSGAWVFGVEGNFDWTSLDATLQNPVIGPTQGHAKLNWLGTATARIGYAVDRSLLYVKGGAAWGDVKSNSAFAGVVFAGPDSSTNSGWVLGAGWEYAFAPNWSGKIEYDYVHLSDSFTSNCPTCALQPTPAATKVTISEVLVGLNYRFGSR